MGVHFHEGNQFFLWMDACEVRIAQHPFTVALFPQLVISIEFGARARLLPVSFMRNVSIWRPGHRTGAPIDLSLTSFGGVRSYLSVWNPQGIGE